MNKQHFITPDKMRKTDLFFENLVREHKATIYSVCYMFASGRAEADDLFQEVLLNIWKGIDSYRSESSLRSWIYRIALNTCLTYKRKKRINTEPLDIAPAVFETSTTEGRQTEDLHRRIMRLAPMDRALIMLWLEDMSYQEIGQILGIEPKHVGVKLVRIKEKLKQIAHYEN